MEVLLTDKSMLSPNFLITRMVQVKMMFYMQSKKKKILLPKSLEGTVYCKYIYGYANAVAVHCVS